MQPTGSKQLLLNAPDDKETTKPTGNYLYPEAYGKASQSE